MEDGEDIQEQILGQSDEEERATYRRLDRTKETGDPDNVLRIGNDCNAKEGRVSMPSLTSSEREGAYGFPR